MTSSLELLYINSFVCILTCSSNELDKNPSSSVTPHLDLSITTSAKHCYYSFCLPNRGKINLGNAYLIHKVRRPFLWCSGSPGVKCPSLESPSPSLCLLPGGWLPDSRQAVRVLTLESPCPSLSSEAVDAGAQGLHCGHSEGPSTGWISFFFSNIYLLIY